MDPVSQGALGAACGGGAADRRRVVAAGVVATLAGMAPDLDVLIRSSDDPLLFLEFHRQFSHSLTFVPVGAAVCALLAHPLMRRWLTLSQSFLFCLLGYASHGMLDACTSYGTQLLWPFSDARIAWNVVSVVDPLFTLPLLALVTGALVARRAGLARLGLVWAAAYLTLGAVQQERALRAAMALAEARGQQPQRLLVKPSLGNLLVWKSLYAADGSYHVDGLRLGRVVSYFPGERVRALNRHRDLPWLAAGSRQAQDLERFRWFSDGYLAMDPERPGLVIDVRYSMLPDRIDGLWGIRMQSGAPDRHVEFTADRSSSAAQRSALWRRLSGPGLTLAEAAGQDP